MRAQIVLVGRGGQGVLFATRVVAEAAMREGLDVLCAEIHGMAQRGGTVVSHVKIGGFASPLVRRGAADLAIAFAGAEGERARSFLRPGGVCVAESPGPELGVGRAATPALLGFAAARAPGLLPPAESLREALARRASEASRDANLRAFDAGLRAGAAR